MAIFLTVVPTSILSFAQNYNRNFSFTAIISPEDKQISPGIVLTPNLTLNGDFVCVLCAWIITLFGAFNFMRRNNCIGQFVSAFLIIFTILQTLTAIYNVVFSNQWIFKILGGSWQRAYNVDIELVREIEDEFSCKGYLSTSNEMFEESCSKILMQKFGPQFFYIAKLIGVIIHAFIFDCITLHDIRQCIYGDNEGETEEDYFFDDKDFIISNESNSLINES
ncbi:764_t:CDS:2 [Diversispora eburnea]|uniref:764_t:CDS:1 n=1 Tax=Diversispora eburnea TaxID=1213867 RepID=A0A9N8UYQ9_9GLOM|nr:764_t:CDS:2 [Diversispora eburnea]